MQYVRVAGWRSWPMVLAACVIGASIVGGTIVVANTITYVKALDTSLLTVTGSAEQVVTSDEVKWPSSFSRQVPAEQLQNGYAQMKHDMETVASYLSVHKVAQRDVTFAPIAMSPIYSSCNDAGKPGISAPGCVSQVVAYRLTQNVVVNSSQVDAITSLAQDAGSLVDQGVLFSSQPPEYYVSSLPDLRVQLLGAATKDAQTRAEQIAASTGAKVGRLVTASSGVIQVTPVNSTEVSNEGTYDTSTIQKEVTAVVRASFTLGA